MRKSLLEHPRLSEIELTLNEARYEEAQRLLAELPDGPGADSARVYFATRLLFERGRLDREGVIERLRELLRTSPNFPEAERMLRAAEAGQLEPTPSSGGARTHPADPPSERESLPDPFGAIPRAPPVPHFGRNDASPSYAPPTIQAPPPISQGEPIPSYDTELSPPPAPPAAWPPVPSLELPAVKPPLAVRDPSDPPEPFSTIPSPEPPPPSSSRASQAPVTPAASLVEIADLLDRHRAQDALRLAETAEPSPELSLLKARAFSSVGDIEGTERELAKLLRAPLLDPGLRSATARLLIALDAPDRAREQAEHALRDDPKDPMARVTGAWALVRLDQRGFDDHLVEAAEPLLTSLRLRDTTLSALLPALRAWVAARRGDPARALGLARTALDHDPGQMDALAASALASLKLGLFTDAERALLRLGEHAPAAARRFEAALRDAGFFPKRTAVDPAVSEAAVAALFGDAETALVHGRPELAILGFERACSDRLRALSRRGGTESWRALATAAARLFTELPVLRHFAPYDCSMFSVDRLGAAFDVLYGSSTPGAFGDENGVLLATAYVGEALRQALGGEWRGTPDDPQTAAVQAVGRSIHPYAQVARAVREREPLRAQQPEHLHPGADPFGNTVPLTLAPPAPWDPEPWPALHRVVEIGRLLPYSVIGAFCARQGTPLDGSVSSVAAIDRFVALLAPLKAPPALEAAWTRRAAVLVGAYVGEVLARAVGARWQDGASTNNAGAYRLTLKDGSVTTPIARALDRLSGRRVSPLSDYVARIVAGRASIRP